MQRVWWLPGAAMIFFGVMIFIYPELLSFIVAMVFMFIGLTMLTVGRNMRRMWTGSITSYRMNTYQQPGDRISYD